MLIYHNLGPTMILGATRASLDHCFILKIFLIHLSKNILKNLSF
jgi:hypothetical protein